MRKKFFVLIVTLLMVCSTIMIIPNDLKVEADPGGDGGGDNGSLNLDNDFMWNVTHNLSMVVHNAYTEGEIRKARSFGSEGDHWTADYIEELMNDELNLEDVIKIKIENISDIPPEYYFYRDFYYNYIIDAIEFNLTINGDDYPFTHSVPINELSVIPSGTVNNRKNMPKICQTQESTKKCGGFGEKII